MAFGGPQNGGVPSSFPLKTKQKVSLKTDRPGFVFFRVGSFFLMGRRKETGRKCGDSDKTSPAWPRHQLTSHANGPTLFPFSSSQNGDHANVPLGASENSLKRPGAL